MRGCVPPQEEGREDCQLAQDNEGLGGGLFTPTTSWLPSALVGLLYSAGSAFWLVDSVAGPQGRLLAFADPSIPLAVRLVHPQELGRAAHCLSMESSPFSFATASRVFTKLLAPVLLICMYRHVSCFPTSMTSFMVRRLPARCLALATLSLLSLRTGVHCEPAKVAACPRSSDNSFENFY